MKALKKVTIKTLMGRLQAYGKMGSQEIDISFVPIRMVADDFYGNVITSEEGDLYRVKDEILFVGGF